MAALAATVYNAAEGWLGTGLTFGIIAGQR